MKWPSLCSSLLVKYKVIPLETQVSMNDQLSVTLILFVSVCVLKFHGFIFYLQSDIIFFPQDVQHASYCSIPVCRNQKCKKVSCEKHMVHQSSYNAIECILYLLMYKLTFYDQRKSPQKFTLNLYTSHTQRPDPSNPRN